MRLGLALPLLASVLALAALFQGCSTLTEPALRHETGEAIGKGHYKVSAILESARMYQIPPQGSGTAGIDQGTEVFQGSYLGFRGVMGVLPKMDVQLEWVFSFHGGGWRIGTKYELLRKEHLAFAVMGGYSTASASGTVTLHSATAPYADSQTLSANTADISLPVSWRFNKYVAVFSGLNYFHSEANGSAGTEYVVLPNNDTGVNLGVRINVDRIEGDVEASTVRLYDPFTDSMRFVSFYGISVGIVF